MARKSWIFAAVASLAVGALYFWLGRNHIPRATFDSSAYLEAAAKPWSFDQFAYPKPVLVSTVYRLTGDDTETIALVQRLVSLLAWASLGVAVVASLATRRARIVAGIVIALFVLDPVRRGYADVVLSESIADSLFALCLATALLAVRERRRWAIACAVLACAWTLARDTNAIVVVIAAGMVLAFGGRKTIAIVAAPIVVAVFALVSVGLTPAPTHFSVQDGWPIEMTPRGAFAALDNIVDRVLPDDTARAYFVESGMPQVDAMLAVTKQPREPARGGLPGDRADLVLAPSFAEARTWIADHGRGAYLRWLARHLFERIGDIVTNAWTLLGAGEHFFMPKGWKRYGRAHFVDDAFGILKNRVAIVLILVVAALALWRCWDHPLRRLVLCVVASGFVASVAAFYADSSEVGRHCYGHGQQALVGLYLAALLWLDRYR